MSRAGKGWSTAVRWVLEKAGVMDKPQPGLLAVLGWASAQWGKVRRERGQDAKHDKGTGDEGQGNAASSCAVGQVK